MAEDIYHLGIKALIRNETGELLIFKVNLKRLTDESVEHWDLPGGRVEKGETIESTLQREIEEETGITKITDVKPLSTVVSNIRIPVSDGDVGLILSIYTCKIDNASSITLSSEHTEYKWCPPKKAAELLSHKYPQEFVDRIRSLA